jgi:hypothetical protein
MKKESNDKIITFRLRLWNVHRMGFRSSLFIPVVRNTLKYALALAIRIMKSVSQ